MNALRNVVGHVEVCPQFNNREFFVLRTDEEAEETESERVLSDTRQ